MKVILLCFLVSMGNCWAKKITGYSGIKNLEEEPSRELSEKRMWDKAYEYCENSEIPVRVSPLEIQSVYATYWHVLVGIYVSADFECSNRDFTIESEGDSDSRYFAYDADRSLENLPTMYRVHPLISLNFNFIDISYMMIEG